MALPGSNLNVPANQDMIRIGALCAIVGSVIFMAANIVHPRSPNIQITALQVETVAHSEIWVTDHLLLLLGGLLLLPGLLAIRRSIGPGAGSAWAELGAAGAVVSTAIWSVLIAVDGFTSKVVHGAWASASEPEKAVALRVAEALEQIDVGIFSVYIIVFFGSTFMLYGLAVAKSGRFPQWLGWAACALGLASFLDGIAQGYTGLSVLVTNILFASFSSFQTLWLLTMGVLMWRSR